MKVERFFIKKAKKNKKGRFQALFRCFLKIIEDE